MASGEQILGEYSFLLNVRPTPKIDEYEKWRRKKKKPDSKKNCYQATERSPTQNTKLELASVEEEEEKNLHRGHSCFSSEQYVEREKLYS